MHPVCLLSSFHHSRKFVQMVSWIDLFLNNITKLGSLLLPAFTKAFLVVLFPSPSPWPSATVCARTHRHTHKCPHMWVYMGKSLLQKLKSTIFFDFWMKLSPQYFKHSEFIKLFLFIVWKCHTCIWYILNMSTPRFPFQLPWDTPNTPFPHSLLPSPFISHNLCAWLMLPPGILTGLLAWSCAGSVR